MAQQINPSLEFYPYISVTADAPWDWYELEARYKIHMVQTLPSDEHCNYQIINLCPKDDGFLWCYAAINSTSGREVIRGFIPNEQLSGLDPDVLKRIFDQKNMPFFLQTYPKEFFTKMTEITKFNLHNPESMLPVLAWKCKDGKATNFMWYVKQWEQFAIEKNIRISGFFVDMAHSKYIKSTDLANCLSYLKTRHYKKMINVCYGAIETVQFVISSGKEYLTQEDCLYIEGCFLWKGTRQDPAVVSQVVRYIKENKLRLAVHDQENETTPQVQKMQYGMHCFNQIAEKNDFYAYTPTEMGGDPCHKNTCQHYQCHIENARQLHARYHETKKNEEYLGSLKASLERAHRISPDQFNSDQYCFALEASDYAASLYDAHSRGRLSAKTMYSPRTVREFMAENKFTDACIMTESDAKYLHYAKQTTFNENGYSVTTLTYNGYVVKNISCHNERQQLPHGTMGTMGIADIVVRMKHNSQTLEVMNIPEEDTLPLCASLIPSAHFSRGMELTAYPGYHDAPNDPDAYVFFMSVANPNEENESNDTVATLFSSGDLATRKYVFPNGKVEIVPSCFLHRNPKPQDALNHEKFISFVRKAKKTLQPIPIEDEHNRKSLLCRSTEMLQSLLATKDLESKTGVAPDGHISSGPIGLFQPNEILVAPSYNHIGIGFFSKSGRSPNERQHAKLKMLRDFVSREMQITPLSLS